MRIIAGKYKGRRLFTPEGDDIRPTSDRAREAIFNVLMHGSYAGQHVIDQHVVDVCCGTGALGLEALSRGAARATFVDQNKKSLELAKKNALHCGATQQSFFVQADVAKLLPTQVPASLVLMDAPYASALLAPAYQALCAGGWLAANALLVAEQPRDAATLELEGATLADERRYGKANILIYRYIG